jgi:hypothetical protein
MLKRCLAANTPAVFDDPQPPVDGYGSKFLGSSAADDPGNQAALRLPGSTRTPAPMVLDTAMRRR